jgi:EmrB/QacA subfamily drug resistance transporter
VPARWRVLAIVSVAVFMVGLDLFIVNIAFDDIQRSFEGSSVATVSWVLNAYAIVFAALLVSAGRFADRAGRRRVFLAGLLVFVLGSALCGAAPSVGALIAARALQAVGAACLLPTSLALLLPEFPPQERPAAIGVWAAVGGVAAAAGPPLGGLLVGASWRLVFLVNVPIGLAAFAIARRELRESRDPEQQRPDLLGSALLVAAVAVLALGIVKAPEWSWGSARTLGTLAGAAVGLAAFWARCLTHDSPVIDPQMVRIRSFAMANVSSVLFSAAFSAMLLANVLLLQEVWGYSVVRAGMAVAPGPLMAAAFAFSAGKYVNRVGQRTLGAAGTGLFGVGCAWWLWRVGTDANYLGDVLPGLLITGVGVGFTLPSLASAAAASLPPARFATGSAVYSMSRQIGFALGVAILVAVLAGSHATDPADAFDGGWLFMVIASGAAVLAALGIGVVQPAAMPAAAPAAPVAPVAAEAAP